MLRHLFLFIHIIQGGCLALSLGVSLLARADAPVPPAPALSDTRQLNCEDLPGNLRRLFFQSFVDFRQFAGPLTRVDAERFAILLGYAGPESSGYTLAANDEVPRDLRRQQMGLSGQETYLDRMLRDNHGGWKPRRDVRASLESYRIIFDLGHDYRIEAGGFMSHQRVFQRGDVVGKMTVNAATSCGLLAQSADQRGRGVENAFLRNVSQLAITDPAAAVRACGSDLMFKDGRSSLGREIQGLALRCGGAGDSLCYCQWVTLCPEANVFQGAASDLQSYFALKTRQHAKPQCLDEFLRRI